MLEFTIPNISQEIVKTITNYQNRDFV